MKLENASTTELVEVIAGVMAAWVRSLMLVPMVTVGIGLVWSWYAAGWLLLAWAVLYFTKTAQFVYSLSKKYGGKF